VELAPGDRIVSVVPVPQFDPGMFLLFVTRYGRVKRTALSEYANVRSGGIRAMGLGGEDQVMTVRQSVGTADLLLATQEGLAIRFAEEEIRPMGRTARGVRGIDIGKGDALVSALAPRRDSELLVIGADGFGKRVPFTDLKRQGRAGKGMALLPDTDRAGRLVGVLAVHPGDLGMCEMASGEVVPVAVETLPVKPRRGASVRMDALSGRAGPVVAVHPLRVSAGGDSAEGDSAEAEDSGAGEVAADSTAAVESGLDRADQGPASEEQGAADESQGELGF
jgi:DNA gyrase subunit A